MSEGTGTEPEAPKPRTTWADAFETLFSGAGMAGVILAVAYGWRIATGG